MVTVRPLFDSSGRDCASGSEMSPPPCIIGAVIMKMIIGNIITSIRLTTLISALRASLPRPRPRRAISSFLVEFDNALGRASDHSLSHHQRDQLGAYTFQLAFDPVESRSEDVVGKDGRNRDAQRRRSCDQRFCHAGSNCPDVTRTFGRDADECVYYPQHLAEEPDQWADRADRRQRWKPAG